jgi:stress response protein YsnF
VLEGGLPLAPRPRAGRRRRETAEVTRSEEEVDFKVKPAQPKERVRLRKHTVIEHVEKTVPVLREEVRLEHDPPKGGRIVSVEDVDEV